MRVWVPPHVRDGVEVPGEFRDIPAQQVRLASAAKDLVRLAKVYVPPHVRVVDGKVVRVEGYTREYAPGYTPEAARYEEMTREPGHYAPGYTPEAALYEESTKPKPGSKEYNRETADLVNAVYSSYDKKRQRLVDTMGSLGITMEDAKANQVKYGYLTLDDYLDYLDRAFYDSGWLSREDFLRNQFGLKKVYRLSRGDGAVAKLAKVYIPPYIRAIDGRPTHVGGYWRDQDVLGGQMGRQGRPRRRQMAVRAPAAPQGKAPTPSPTKAPAKEERLGPMKAKNNRFVLKVTDAQGRMVLADTADGKAEADQMAKAYKAKGYTVAVNQEKVGPGGKRLEATTQVATVGDSSIRRDWYHPMDGSFEGKKWSEMDPFKEARPKWESVSQEERDRVADPVHTIPAAVDDIRKKLPKPPKGDTLAAVKTRGQQYEDAGLVESGGRKVMEHHMTELTTALRDVGNLDEDGIRETVIEMMDLIAVQEAEAQGRTLGDHGARHLWGDAEMAMDILDVIPPERLKGRDRAKMRAEMMLVGLMHDAAYLTPPSQAWLDRDHQRHASMWFDATQRERISQLLDPETADEMSRLIASHDAPEMDWDKDPVVAAFRLADNLALFHREKLPPVLRYVPANTPVLVRFAMENMSVEEAKAAMRRNIIASDLPPEMKTRLLMAVEEVTGIFPKKTLGMLGASVGQVTWEDDHPVLDLIRTPANDALLQVLDMGQKQFAKLAETFGLDPDEFIASGGGKIPPGDGRTTLEVRLKGIEDYSRRRSRRGRRGRIAMSRAAEELLRMVGR